MEDFKKITDEMKIHGMKLPEEKVYLNISNAKNIMKEALDFYIGKTGGKTVWQKEYDHIAEWLEDNKGLGLLLHGKCGLGKTIMGRCVIPAVLLHKCGKVAKCIDTTELNKNLDEILSKKIISIDDVGTEEVSVKYGEKDSRLPN